MSAKSTTETNETATVLTRSEEQAVKDTWALVYTNSRSNGLELFLRLFKQIPHAKGYFEKFKDEPEENLKQSDELKFHVGKMMDSLNVLVGNLGNKEFLVTETQTIARDHKNRSVTSQDFKLVFEILQNMLKDKLGDKYNAATEVSWKKCCDVIWNIVDAEMKRHVET